MDNKGQGFSFRSGSSRNNRRKAIIESEDSPGNDEDLNFRVQEKGANDPDVSRKSRLGNMLKDATSIKGSAAETFKRPLTGLFRRPNSRSGNRKKEDEEDVTTGQPPTNFRGPTKFTSALEDVVLNDDSPRNREADRGDGSTRTQFGNETIARAPTVSAAKLNSMLGDDGVNSKLSYLFKVEGIDVSILARHILPEDEVIEEDVPWTWDHLYASLSSELRDEWAADNEMSLSARM